jgi:lysophospholipase L1-like esterase
MRRMFIVRMIVIVGGLVPGVLVSAQAAEETVIVTLGDSITKGVRSGVTAEQTFAGLLQREFGDAGAAIKVVNQGIGGERTDQALRRLEQEILSLKPAIVTVMYGTNDSYVDQGKSASRLSEQQFETNLRELVERMQAANVKVVLMTEPCWGKSASKNGLGEHPDERLQKYMASTRLVAAEKQVPLVDHYQIWTKHRDAGNDPGEWTTDQCHPNPVGHRELAKAMLPVLKSLLK